jgi:hypothetical protein
MSKLTCFDPRDEEKLARGWPNLIVPIDGDKADKSAVASSRAALKAFRASDPVHFTEWPRKTLMRYLRAKAAVLDAKATSYDKRYAEKVKLAEKACAEDAPLTSEEATATLRRTFAKSDDIYPFQTEGVVYGVETIAGTDAVLDALTTGIDEHAEKQPSATMTNMTATLGFLLLRASPAAAARARATLEKVHGRAGTGLNGELASFIEAIDLAIHGADAVRRTLASSKWVRLDGGIGLIGRPELEYANDTALVCENMAKAKPDQSMSVRVAWLGGSDTLRGLASRKWMARQMPSVVRDFGMFRAPEVAELMLSLIGKSSVKDGPMNWFRAHADYAKSLLAKSKSETAKSVLRQLA